MGVSAYNSAYTLLSFSHARRQAMDKANKQPPLTDDELKAAFKEYIHLAKYLDAETGKYFASLEVVRIQYNDFATLLNVFDGLKQCAEEIKKKHPAVSIVKLVQAYNLFKAVTDFHQALIENYDEARKCYKSTNDRKDELVAAIDEIGSLYELKEKLTRTDRK
jgi:hypothetical protein